MEKAGIPVTDVEEVFMGQVVTANCGQVGDRGVFDSSLNYTLRIQRDKRQFLRVCQIAFQVLLLTKSVLAV